MTYERLNFSVAYSFADDVVRMIGETDPDVFLPPDRTFLSRIRRPHQDTLLHHYIRRLADEEFGHARNFLPHNVTDFEELIEGAGFRKPAWLTVSQVSRHQAELDRLVASAIGRVTVATFHVLFNDVRFLREFQHRVVSKAIEDMGRRGRRPTGITKAGYVERARPPAWLKQAIFHRDKGTCQHCTTNLTGVVNRGERVDYDHILPLKEYGSNDPTNWQLLCRPCNLKKGPRPAEGRWLTEMFWSVPDQW